MSVFYNIDIVVERNAARLQYEVYDTLKGWRPRWVGPGANYISVNTTEMGVKMILELLAIKQYKLRTLAYAKDSNTEIVLVFAESTPAVLERLRIQKEDLRGSHWYDYAD